MFISQLDLETTRKVNHTIPKSIVLESTVVCTVPPSEEEFTVMTNISVCHQLSPRKTA
jgi:hypothetical protein